MPELNLIPYLYLEALVQVRLLYGGRVERGEVVVLVLLGVGLGVGVRVPVVGEGVGKAVGEEGGGGRRHFLLLLSQLPLQTLRQPATVPHHLVRDPNNPGQNTEGKDAGLVKRFAQE